MTFRFFALSVLSALFLTACDEVVVDGNRPTGQSQTAAKPLPARSAARSFADVSRRMEPVTERVCRERTSGVNCDFRIVIDDRRNQPPNAYQTIGKDGRPLIIFTIGLIESTRNADELAFVLGHEAAHHIESHLSRQRQNAIAGAVLLSGLATLSGSSAADVQSAQRLGAAVGARSYSKAFELEADRLGTVITKRAGFDPLRGAQFFNRIPDPGNRFLGTHPPNAQRLKVVRETAAKL